MDFAVKADHRVKIKESEQRQVLEPCQRTKKSVEHERSVILIAIGLLVTVPSDLEKGLKELEIGGGIETI